MRLPCCIFLTIAGCPYERFARLSWEKKESPGAEPGYLKKVWNLITAGIVLIILGCTGYLTI